MARLSKHKQWIATTAAVAVALLTITACSDSESDSENTTSTTAASTNTTRGDFQVDTPDGQVSLSLNGKLPANWPSNFPLPNGAKPEGSGSLGGKESTTVVGVFSAPGSAEQTFQFYKDNPAFTITSSSSVGAGNSFAGRIKMTAPYPGSLTITTDDPGANIVAVLETAGTTNSSVATTAPPS